MKQPQFPIKVKRGSATVRVYFTPSKGYNSYTVSYHSQGSRKRRVFANLDEAKTEAAAKAIELSNGELESATLSRAQCASFLRALELLAPTGCAIEVAAGQFADAAQRLGGVSLAKTVDFYLERHEGVTSDRTVRAVVDELLAAKRGDRLSDRYLQTLSYELGVFATKFTGGIGEVRGREIEAWLREKNWSPRTRKNFRTSLLTLFNFAKGKRYLHKDHDELDAVSVTKARDEEIEIYSPAELQEILAVTPAAFVPFVVLGAFAGIRHAEIQRLDWQDVRWEAGVVEIGASKAKTASRRTVPILPCLEAWLRPHRQASGLVCAHRNMSEAFKRIAAAVNQVRRERDASAPEFKWKHNALRHSFISYRVAAIQNVAQVALEAGNSPQVIFSNYRELVLPEAAKQWFEIRPG